MLTSIVILTYNQLEYTYHCINSIRKYTPKDSYEIIIVDNASSDDTVAWLSQQSDLKVIYNDKNRGFPAGCNQGIALSKGDNILLLNNDVIVTEKWLDNMLTCLYNSEDIGAVGCVTNNCSYYQNITVNYKNDEELQNFAAEYNQSNPALWEERLKLIGFCFLVKREVVNKVGLLDERYSPGHFEDDDYSFRIRQMGYKLMLCKDTFIHHFGSVSFKQNNDLFQSGNIIGARIFTEKWGFLSTDYTYIHYEIINLIQETYKNQDFNVLEISCGCGATLLQIKNQFKNVQLYGVECNENAAKFAKSFAEVYIGAIENSYLEYPEKFFDFILLPDVLERLCDPWCVIKRLHKYLKDGGVIIASFSNIMHYSVIQSLLQGRWKYEETGILDKTHLRFFTLYEIVDMFSQNGFLVKNVLSNNSPICPKDKDFIDKLTAEFSEKSKNQFMAYQYIVECCKN
jgi:GT2 family glycosyltransferase